MLLDIALGIGVNTLVSTVSGTPLIFGLVVSTYMWTPPEFATARIEKHRDELNLGKIIKIVDTSCPI